MERQARPGRGSSAEPFRAAGLFFVAGAYAVPVLAQALGAPYGMAVALAGGAAASAAGMMLPAAGRGCRA